MDGTFWKLTDYILIWLSSWAETIPNNSNKAYLLNSLIKMISAPVICRHTHITGADQKSYLIRLMYSRKTNSLYNLFGILEILCTMLHVENC